jgi:hypothetical protein
MNTAGNYNKKKGCYYNILGCSNNLLQQIKDYEQNSDGITFINLNRT